MDRRTLVSKLHVVCALGLICLAVGLYMWAAVVAPVVQWSDSAVDLKWAGTGEGITHRPVVAQGVNAPHSAKPLYLAFLRLSSSWGPSRAPRVVVVLQTALLLGCYIRTAWMIRRRYGTAAGVAAFLLFVLFLPIRDAATAVMPEALAAALFLPLVVLIAFDTHSDRQAIAVGCLMGMLFLVRPNLAAIALVLLLLRSRRSDLRALGLAFLAAGTLALPLFAASRRGEGPLVGRLSFSVLEGSGDYLWGPALRRGTDTTSAAELTQAVANWKATLTAANHDTWRQVAWRTLHGVFGSAYYDARWSPGYHLADTASRMITPVVLCVAIGVCLAALPGSPPAIVGATLTVLLLCQSLFIGALPRYSLPALPGLLAVALITARTQIRQGAWRRRALLGGGVLTILVFLFPAVADWEWGRVEAAGVALVQRIPARALPAQLPATLHVRIAPVSRNTWVVATGPDGEPLEVRSDRDRPALEIALPQALVAANRMGPVDITLTGQGTFSPRDYLLFPVLSPLLRPPAARRASDELSPTTGIVRGSLDWWAHSGTP